MRTKQPKKQWYQKIVGAHADAVKMSGPIEVGRRMCGGEFSPRWIFCFVQNSFCNFLYPLTSSWLLLVRILKSR